MTPKQKRLVAANTTIAALGTVSSEQQTTLAALSSLHYLFETIHDLNVYKKELDSTIVNKFVEEKRKEFLALSEEDFQSKLKELQPELKARLDKVLVYSRNDLHQLPSVLSEGQILLATNLAGRGADIDITKSVEKAGGLHVCITFLPINERVEDQNIGRTARKGQPGTAEMILNLSPLYDSGLIFRSEQAITVDLVRRRREERVRQQLSQILYSETKKRMLHDSYYAQVHALSLKLGGGARKQNEAYRIVDAKLDELMELWALQYHQMSSQAVYATQEKELSDQIKLLADPLDENAIGFRVTHALEPDVLFELIAKELSISRETLQKQFLRSVWSGLSNKNPSLFEKKLLSYLEQPLTMLELLSRLTQTTMVVVDQKGKISVFRGGDKKTIVLGRVTGGLDAPKTLDMKSYWSTFDTPDDDTSLLHAISHQKRLLGEKEDLRKLPSSEKWMGTPWSSYTKEEQKNYGSPESFVKTHDCILAIADDKILDKGYRYVYCNGTEVITTEFGCDEHSLPHKKIYRLLRQEIEENVFDDAKRTSRLHYKSVFSDPFHATDPVSIVPSVFDVTPHYRGLNKPLIKPTQPTYLREQYGVQSPIGGRIPDTIKKIIDETPHLLQLPIEVLDQKNDKMLINTYKKSLNTYFESYYAKEKAYMDPIMAVFLKEVERRFKENSLCFSPEIVNKLISSNLDQLDKIIWDALGTDPVMRAITYYGQAQYFVEQGYQNYRELAKAALKHGQDGLPEAFSAWDMIYALSGQQAAEEGEPELKKERQSPLSKQIHGRHALANSLYQNMDENWDILETSYNKGQEDPSRSVRLGQREMDFTVFNVLPEDQSSLKAMGIRSIYMLEEIPPEPSGWDIFCMAALGTFQVIKGALLVCSVAGANLGITMIQEGMKDLIHAVDSLANKRVIKWGKYWLSKAYSYSLCFLKGAVKAVQEKSADVFKSMNSFAFGEKTIDNVADKMTAENMVTGAVLGGLWSWGGHAIANSAKEEFLKKIKESIRQSAKQAMNKLRGDEVFQKDRRTLRAYQLGVGHVRSRNKEKELMQHMNAWALDNTPRDILQAVQTLSGSLKTVDETRVSEAINFFAHMAEGAHNTVQMATFLNSYCNELKRYTKVLVKGLPSLVDLLEDTSKAGDGIKNRWLSERWVKHAMEMKFIRGDKPYGITSSGGEDSGVILQDLDQERLDDLGWCINENEALESWLDVPLQNPVGSGGYWFVVRMLKGKESIEGTDALIGWEDHLVNMFTHELRTGALNQVAGFVGEGISLGLSAVTDNLLTEFRTNSRMNELKAANDNGTITNTQINELSWFLKRACEKQLRDQIKALKSGADENDQKWLTQQIEAIEKKHNNAYQAEIKGLFHKGVANYEQKCKERGIQPETGVAGEVQRLEALAEKGKGPSPDLLIMYKGWLKETSTWIENRQKLATALTAKYDDQRRQQATLQFAEEQAKKSYFQKSKEFVGYEKKTTIDDIVEAKRTLDQQKIVDLLSQCETSAKVTTYNGLPKLTLKNEEFEALMQEVGRGEATVAFGDKGYVKVKSKEAGEFYFNAHEAKIVQVTQHEGIEALDLDIAGFFQPFVKAAGTGLMAGKTVLTEIAEGQTVKSIAKAEGKTALTSLAARVSGSSAENVALYPLLKRNFVPYDVATNLAEMSKKAAGEVVAGAGHKTPLRDVPRLIAKYGGKAEDWAKVRSPVYKINSRPDLSNSVDIRPRVHWYQNTKTGERVEAKVKIDEGDSITLRFFENNPHANPFRSGGEQ
jgi:hypothetical protein